MRGLIASKEIEVRFSDTDAMGVIWHGNYLRYFEDGREYFGKKFSIDYLDIHNMGFFVPIAESFIKHLDTINYGDKVEVRIKYVYNKASKMEFKYELFNLTTNSLSATGSSIQVFIDAESRKMILSKPQFFKDWENKQDWVDV